MSKPDDKQPNDKTGEGAGKKVERVRVLQIISKVNGFRRGGIAHPDHPVFHRAGKFTEEQIKQLKAEPKLIVAEGEGPDPEKDPDYYADAAKRGRDDD